MARYLLFFLVILSANIIQGITGFAGTILAMPLSLMLVGYSTAKPVLNVLAMLSGFYVFVGNYKRVCWKELRKIAAIMAVGIVVGILIRDLFVGREKILYQLLGVFVIVLALQGILSMLLSHRAGAGVKKTPSFSADSPVLYLLLVMAGIVHGIFVSGGPLLIGYLTRKINDKVQFRATISTVWIFLNGIVLADDLWNHLWNPPLAAVFFLAVPFLLIGMVIGSRLQARMSQSRFMKITYVLLFLSGVSLLVK